MIGAIVIWFGVIVQIASIANLLLATRRMQRASKHYDALALKTKATQEQLQALAFAVQRQFNETPPSA